MSGLDQNTLMRQDYFALRHAKSGASTEAKVAASQALLAQRQRLAQQLDLTLMNGLPVSDAALQIRTAIADHPVVIVAGETGSGKTTQLPKFCLQNGLGLTGSIGHTQPRRIAARTVAQRIAQEVGAELGDAVGYSVRFSDRSNPQSLLRVMTDGLLLTEIRRDRYLNAYDAIIVDEAHERSLNIDFLLGYLNRLLIQRQDLRVIVTSATIDVQRFADYFAGAPVIEVGGRSFPVTTRYVEDDADTLTKLVDVLNTIDATPPGRAPDVLAFFAAEREIFDAAKALRMAFGERFEILPLYARLSLADQRRVFNPQGAKRRIVLATNVAETSLTVPNIGYVIDPGFARISRYSYRSKLQRLPIEPISQASANQRQGRCGRIAPGICYRLYSEQDFSSRQAYTDAEIRRVNLASVVLQMHAYGLGDISKFPFVDPPEPRAIKDALRLLTELRALQGSKITALGKRMARLPVDPRLAAMLMAAGPLGSLNEMLVIVAGLAVQDVRERPAEKVGAADAAHEKFIDEQSDFLGYLKLWTWIEAQREQLSNRAWQAELRRQFVNPMRVREWREIHRQLRTVCRQLKLSINSKPANYRQIHEAVVAGSLSQIALHQERGRYQGPRNLQLSIFPGSGLKKATPKWLVAAEVVETRRVFARCVGGIEAKWVEAHAEHLVKRSFSDPVWSLKRGEVIAYEKVTLYGLTLIDRRTRSFAPVDPALCRDLFLREGMVHGAIQQPPEFLVHNLERVAWVQDQEAKGRRRDLMVDDDALYQFYAERLPSKLCRVADLKHWLRGVSPQELAGLRFDENWLLKNQSPTLQESDFPNHLEFAGVSLPLRYRFAPGTAEDGISVDIPVGLAPNVNPEMFNWSVPGMLPAVVEQWLRTLPKNKRRVLAPLPDKLEEICLRLLKPEIYRQGQFLAVLGGVLEDLYRLQVDVSDWDRQRVPEHLHFYCRIIDPEGRAILADRDFASVQQRLRSEHSTSLATPTDNVIEAFVQRQITALPEDKVPDQVIAGTRQAPVIVYPGLSDAGTHVDLELFSSARERDRANRRGYARLMLQKLGKAGTYFRRQLAQEKELGLYFSALGSAQQLSDQLMLNVIWYCYFEGRELPRNADQFAERAQSLRGELAEVFAATVDVVRRSYKLRFQVMTRLDELDSPAFNESKQDIVAHLQRLIPSNVLEITPCTWLPLLPRYIGGILGRVQNLTGHVPKDISLLSQLQPLQQRFSTLQGCELADNHALQEVRFFLEELRLKTFTEALAKQRTEGAVTDPRHWKVSMKRIQERMLSEERLVGLA